MSCAEGMHYALIYRGADEYVDGIRQFFEPGLAAGEPLVAAVPGPHLDLLRDGLGEQAAQVELIDMRDFGRNPGRIIAAVQAKVAGHGGRRVHYVGEPIWKGRTHEEICEATRHEALINLAFLDAPVRILCPYDAVGLDEAVLANAACTHPRLLDGGRELPSPAYGGHLPPAGCDEPLSEPPGDAAALDFDLDGLGRVRAAVAERAGAAGLSRGRVEDLVLAVNEVATNSVLHASAHGTLRVWHAGGSLTCEVSDDGHIADPLAGRRPPIPGVLGGRGLWLVHELCDLVETRTGHDGTAVRLHARLAA